jgi:cytoskeletal protein RodZ
MLDRVRTRSSRLRKFGVLVAWLAAAGAATVVGAIAVGAIGSGILPQAERPLSPQEVNDRLAQATSGPAPTTTSSTASGTSPTSTPPTGHQPDPTELFNSQGGSVIARCAPDLQVVSATPSQGYRLKDVEPEDGGQRVRFESGHTRIEIRLVCVAGRPVATTR